MAASMGRAQNAVAERGERLDQADMQAERLADSAGQFSSLAGQIAQRQRNRGFFGGLFG